MNSKRIGAAILAAFLAALLTFGAVWGLSQTIGSEDTILIYNNNPESGKVSYRGAAKDGVWYSPQDTVLQPGVWEWEPDQEIYTASNIEALRIVIPKGKNRTLTFNAGPDQGVVRVEGMDQVLTFDLYQENEVAQGLPFPIPDSFGVMIHPGIIPTPCVVVFLVVLMTMLMLPNKKQ